MHTPILLCADTRLDIKNSAPINEQLDFIGEECLRDFIVYLKKKVVEPQLKLQPDERAKLLVIAHNGHRYDDIFILPLLYEYFGAQVSLLGSASAIKILNVAGILEFRDSMELIPGALANLGPEF